MTDSNLLIVPMGDASPPRSEDARSEQGILATTSAPGSNEKHTLPTNRRRTVIIASICLLVLALALGLGLGLGLGLKNGAQQLSQGQTSKPNVIVIMSDDQDIHLDSMSVMPNVNKWFGDGGVRYNSHYCTVALCCPSRVNFLTGKASHNTNVTNLHPPWGGWEKFTQQELNDNYLPVWINESGIETYYVGKLMNGYSKKLFASPAHPRGWTESSFLVDPHTYDYYQSMWTNGESSELKSFPGIHTTTVTQSKALEKIDHASDSGNQFFMMVAPVAPHQQAKTSGSDHNLAPPIPDKFKGMFDHRIAPRRANFNPEDRSGAAWVYDQDRLTDSEVHRGDVTHYHRLGNIAGVDDMVLSMIERLEAHGILDNTYIIYTTDNGFHIGNHRLLPGKRCPYEEDVNIPFLIRGPDVPKGVNTSLTHSHTDVAPTILQMLGLPLRDDFDGSPMPYTKETLSNTKKNEIVQVELWGSKSHEPTGFGDRPFYNNTYKALRMLSNNYNFYYSTWCTGAHEFHDMTTDLVQMNNLLGPNAGNVSVEYYDRPLEQLINRLDAVLMVTKSCKQDSCRNPWGVMFPNGEVDDLTTAMATTYDSFFENQPKVQFEECTAGYLEEFETPYNVDVFSATSQRLLF